MHVSRAAVNAPDPLLVKCGDGSGARGAAALAGRDPASEGWAASKKALAAAGATGAAPCAALQADWDALTDLGKRGKGGGIAGGDGCRHVWREAAARRGEGRGEC